MAGEYQLAQKLIDQGLEESRGNGGMDEETFARALMHQLVEHNRSCRKPDDIISELEQCIRHVEDEGEAVIARGC